MQMSWKAAPSLISRSLKTKPHGGVLTPAALPWWIRMGQFPVPTTLSISISAATKLAR
jgi:hypothetical protein